MRKTLSGLALAFVGLAPPAVANDCGSLDQACETPLGSYHIARPADILGDRMIGNLVVDLVEAARRDPL